jgi:hypothetical protein
MKRDRTPLWKDTHNGEIANDDSDCLISYGGKMWHCFLILGNDYVNNKQD